MLKIFKCCVKQTTILGDYCGGAPPLPIPNREVKPASADGTAEMWESRSLPNFPDPVFSRAQGLLF